MKDCDGKLLGPAECRELLDRIRETMELEPIEPSAARAVVEGAVRYAESLGLPPHPDYRKVAQIWGDIPVGELPSGLEFGRDGRPFYFAGPYDDLAKQKRIYNALSDSVGEGEFDFVVGGKQQLPGELPPEALEQIEVSEEPGERITDRRMP